MIREKRRNEMIFDRNKNREVVALLGAGAYQLH